MNQTADQDNSELSFWQRTAKKTHGVATPATALSVAGWILTDGGARNMESKKGAVMVVAGEILDGLDGPVARRTNTVTTFGKIFDVTADKFKMLRILKEAEKRDIVDSKKANFIIARNSLNVALAGIAVIRGRHHETNIPGKRAIACEVTSVAADIIASKFAESGHNTLARVAKDIGLLTLGASIPFGIKAGCDYTESAILTQDTAPSPADE